MLLPAFARDDIRIVAFRTETYNFLVSIRIRRK